MSPTCRSAAPLCDMPSGCCSFTGPWTVTRSSLRMLRRVAAFCRPLRPVLPLVSFPRSRSPVVGVPGLCWMWRDVPFACQRRPIVGVLRMCWLLPGSFDCFCCPHTSVHRPSIACLAVFLCGPGALFLHALSGPSTPPPPPPVRLHVWLSCARRWFVACVGGCCSRVIALQQCERSGARSRRRRDDAQPANVMTLGCAQAESAVSHRHISLANLPRISATPPPRGGGGSLGALSAAADPPPPHQNNSLRGRNGIY